MIELQGEIELWISVLWRAAYDFHGRFGADETTQKDAEEWFSSKSTAMGSFLWICNSLDANADYLRERLIAEATPRKMVSTEAKLLRPHDLNLPLMSDECREDALFSARQGKSLAQD